VKARSEDNKNGNQLNEIQIGNPNYDDFDDDHR
jgi:hypothetical protein